jgi:hypothetical protein
MDQSEGPEMDGVSDQKGGNRGSSDYRPCFRRLAFDNENAAVKPAPLVQLSPRTLIYSWREHHLFGRPWDPTDTKDPEVTSQAIDSIGNFTKTAHKIANAT